MTRGSRRSKKRWERARPLLEGWVLRQGPQEGAQDCPLCFGPIETSTVTLVHYNPQTEVGCKHAFCQDCFNEFVPLWDGTQYCPICRQELKDLGAYDFQSASGKAQPIYESNQVCIVSDVAGVSRTLTLESTSLVAVKDGGF